MEPIPENNAGQGNRSAEILPISLGRVLRDAREKLGLSVADVAGQIKFAPRQIEAMEADDFKRLPEAAFLRGFVRSYAKILHLDAEPLLAILPQSNAAAVELVPSSVEVPFPVAHSSQRQNLILLGAALLLAVMVVGFAVWHLTNPVKQANEMKIEPTASVLETPISLPAEMPAIPLVPEQNEIAPSIPVKPQLPSLPSVEQVKPETAAQTAPQAKSAAPRDTHAQINDKTGVQVNGKINEKANKKINEKPIEKVSDKADVQTTTLRLVFDTESWTEIKDEDGKIISSQVNPSGSELHLEGNLPLLLVIGHAASVRLYQDGEQVDLAPYINSASEVARLTLE